MSDLMENLVSICLQSIIVPSVPFILILVNSHHQNIRLNLDFIEGFDIPSILLHYVTSLARGIFVKK